ncbi:MAG: hypothetical protein ACKOAU_08400 [Pirellula sp.]
MMQYFVPKSYDQAAARIIPFGFLLLIACLSSIGSLSRFLLSDPQSIERWVDYQTHRLQSYRANGVRELGASLRAANLYVHSITRHAERRDLAIWENWPQWLLGQFYSPLLRTQNPQWIVSGGFGDCSERAAVLQDLLKSHGVDTRFVGLGGHVVLEARGEQGAWILDPDYGVVIDTDLRGLQDQDSGDLTRWLVEQGVAPARSIQYERMVRTSQDNVALGWNEPLSPRLKKIESLCELAIWLAPVFFWVLLGKHLRWGVVAARILP